MRMYITLRGFLTFVFAIFITTTSILLWDTWQSGNIGGSLSLMGVQALGLVALILAIVIWRIK